MAVTTPATFALTMAGGADWFLGFRIYQLVDGVKTPVDLSGYTGILQMRLSYTSAEPALTLTNGAGITLGADGSILVHATAAQVDAILPETYEIGLQIASGGTKYSILEQQIDKLETAVANA